MAKPPCNCARCCGLKTADPRWGFDWAKVRRVRCLYCDRPIGNGPYRPITTLARFGQMLFRHEDCRRKQGTALRSHRRAA